MNHSVMDNIHNIVNSITDDSTKKRQENEPLEKKKSNEGIEKVEKIEKDENEKMNKNDSNDINKLNDVNNKTDSYFSNNKDNNPCDNENKSNLQDKYVQSTVPDKIVSNLNLTKNLSESIVDEDVKELNDNSTSKICQTEKNNRDVSNNENKNFEKKVSMNMKPSVTPSKTNTRSTSSGPLYIEVKGLLEVINVEDFAVNLGIKNATLSSKPEQQLTNKRSYSVPAKAITKSIPKDSNKQNYKNYSFNKIVGPPKTTNTQKKPPLPYRNLSKQTQIMKKPADSKSTIVGKTLDANKGKTNFRVLFKKANSPNESNKQPKVMIKPNIVPLKAKSNEDKGKGVPSKTTNSLVKIPYKITPILNKDKNDKNMAPLKYTTKQTLEDLKKVLDKKDKEINKFEKSNNTLNENNEVKKNPLIPQKIIKPKLATKISSLKKEPIKKEKAVLDEKKTLIKKPISKLVNSLKTKEKEKKKKIHDKDMQDKKEKLSKSTIEKNTKNIDKKEKEKDKINPTNEKEKKQKIDDTKDLKKEEIDIDKKQIDASVNDEESTIKGEKSKLDDKEDDTVKGSNLDDKKNLETERKNTLDDTKELDIEKEKILSDQKESEIEKKQTEDNKEIEIEKEEENTNEKKEPEIEKKKSELEEKEEKIKNNENCEKELKEDVKEIEKKKNDIKKNADLKLNKKPLKKNENSLLKKQDIKPVSGLKPKATMKMNAISFKSKGFVDSNLKEKKNLKNENTVDLTKNNFNKSLPQRKIAPFKKSIDIKKIALSKNTIKEVDKKKVEKMINGSFNNTMEIKKDTQGDADNIDISKKSFLPLSKSNLSVLKKKSLSKSKTENMQGIKINKNKLAPSSKSEITEDMIEKDKIKQKDEQLNESGLLNKKSLFKNRKILSSKLSKLNGKSNTSSTKKLSSFSDTKNKKTLLTKNVISSKGVLEKSKISSSSKDIKPIKKLKSKVSKKVVSDILNKEEKITKKYPVPKIPKKIKTIPSKIKMDKNIKKTKIENSPKGTSNIFKMKDKKLPKKNKVLSNDEVNNVERNDMLKNVNGSEKMRNLKENKLNKYIIPKIGIHKPKNIIDKLNMSTSNVSNKLTARSNILSSSSKKSKNIKKKVNNLTINDKLKNKLINANVSKILLNSNVIVTNIKDLPKLEIPQLSNINKFNENGEETRRIQKIGDPVLSKMYKRILPNINKNKSAYPSRDLSLPIQIHEYKMLGSEKKPCICAKHLNKLRNLCNRTNEEKKNSNWVFSKCCSSNNNKNIYERREPILQNFSSLFNVNNKYIPRTLTAEVLAKTNNSIKMSNIYESNLFTNNMQNVPTLLTNNFNTTEFINKENLNNYTLRLKKMPTGSRKASYCNCI